MKVQLILQSCSLTREQSGKIRRKIDTLNNGCQNFESLWCKLWCFLHDFLKILFRINRSFLHMVQGRTIWHCARYEGALGSGNITPRVFNLGTVWSFLQRLSYTVLPQEPIDEKARRTLDNVWIFYRVGNIGQYYESKYSLLLNNQPDALFIQIYSVIKLYSFSSFQ